MRGARTPPPIQHEPRGDPDGEPPCHLRFQRLQRHTHTSIKATLVATSNGEVDSRFVFTKSFGI